MAKEPRWSSRVVVEAIHYDQIVEHGGLKGLRDEGALETALARPQHKWHYDPKADLPTLAAAYAFGLARNHPFHDGNKRVAFLTMAVFLQVNGLQLDASEEEVVTTIVALAAGELSEPRLTTLIRNHTKG